MNYNVSNCNFDPKKQAMTRLLNSIVYRWIFDHFYTNLKKYFSLHFLCIRLRY